MQPTQRRGPFARLKGAWAPIASVSLALFTAFVLLDTFAIARVQQSAQAADLSSIVAAQQEGSSADDAEASAGSSDGSDGSDSSRSGSASSGAQASPSGSSSSASGTSSYGKGRKHGTHPNRPSGSGDAALSKRGSGAGGMGSATGASASEDDAASVVPGAASASSSGTTVGNYSDENMQIVVSKLRAYDTDIYVADIQVSSAEYLKTALAQNAFGRNLKDTTSNMAESAGAVLAINGDYYGFRDEGYVVRNGVLYRNDASAGTDALVVYGDGTMDSVSQDTTTAEELIAAGAWQVFSFGPTLVDDGKLAVGTGDEVDRSKGSNPRTAIGMVSPLHYLVVVSDGRTGDNEGLSLYELAQVLVDNGAAYAYNLDGGGSTTLYFEGDVINNPTSGNLGGERQVSDIVYFA